MSRALPDKLFFRIGEVASIVGVKPHVLRYWEEEFDGLAPMKTRGSHRHYRRSDVELALRIKALLQDEGFTIAGARKQLNTLRKKPKKAKNAAEPQTELPIDKAAMDQAIAERTLVMRASLLAARKELADLLDKLDRMDERRGRDTEEEAATTVTVHRSVPVSATSWRKRYER